MTYSVPSGTDRISKSACSAGTTVERSLPALGFDGIDDVRVGKAIRYDSCRTTSYTTSLEVEELCERFLTNPVIEDSVITLEAA